MRISASATWCSSRAASPASAIGTKGGRAGSHARGEAVLVEEGGETILRAGDLAPSRRGPERAPPRQPLELGLRVRRRRDAALTDCHYPDIDMHLDARKRPVHPQGRHALLSRWGSSYFSITQGSSCAASSHSRSPGWPSIASI
jgi:hypothetical protein